MRGVDGVIGLAARVGASKTLFSKRTLLEFVPSPMKTSITKQDHMWLRVKVRLERSLTRMHSSWTTPSVSLDVVVDLVVVEHEVAARRPQPHQYAGVVGVVGITSPARGKGSSVA
jgi:hypothetical protein